MKIEKNDDLIHRSWLLQEIEHDLGCFEIEKFLQKKAPLYADLGDIVKMILAAPKQEAVVVPCKIGDFVWAIRNYQGVPHPQQGKVSEMFITKDTKLMIVVSHIARGYWGETIFATYEEARRAITEGKK